MPIKYERKDLQKTISFLPSSPYQAFIMLLNIIGKVIQLGFLLSLINTIDSSQTMDAEYWKLVSTQQDSNIFPFNKIVRKEISFCKYYHGIMEQSRHQVFLMRKGKFPSAYCRKKAWRRGWLSVKIFPCSCKSRIPERKYHNALK